MTFYDDFPTSFVSQYVVGAPFENFVREGIKGPEERLARIFK